ncbi:MAG: kinase [Deltaproteobacteria bacterium]|nr:kinase [Deltaproteobacteria bacterium]
MIISRTPFRISFFGGGTDYPVWYQEHEGAVLATTINKYCYLSVRYLPPFFDYKSRIVWSKIELVKDVAEIQHPSAKATLEFLEINRGIALHHDADLPARSGLGSSSTFTVGLLHSLYGLKGMLASKQQLALDAITIEQKILNESVGCQDQIMAAHGGFNRINFQGENQFHLTPIILPQERLNALQDHLLLFYTGLVRTASDIAKEQIEKTKDKTAELKTMYQMVGEAIRLLTGNADLVQFGKLIGESWKLKRSLTGKISNAAIDESYDAALKAGAIGGKILGAGGGGFLLLFAKPEMHSGIKEALKHLLHVPFRFENLGSQLIYREADGVGAA